MPENSSPEYITRPYIPEYITVHLGPPDSYAQNVTVPFIDYIRNVASSEIYPTWNRAAIRANILAQTSYAMNRVYLEFYRSRGYDFDITNSTAIDQSFVNGRNTFESIDEIVGELFGTYIRRKGFIEPLAARYCNGTTSFCEGMSQWGSENLAQQGADSMQILRKYYGDDIELVDSAPVRPIAESYPGYILQRGSSGNNVAYIQISLNRISDNYPLIPKISPIDGIFGSSTESAVKTFQRTFGLTPDGIVGRATWYQMVLIYTGVTRMAELDSEGQKVMGYSFELTDSIRRGDRGTDVEIIQYLINVIAQYYTSVPVIAVDGVYGAATENAITQLQQQFGLPATGVVDKETWEAMYAAFSGMENATAAAEGALSESRAARFPGVELSYGMSDE